MTMIKYNTFTFNLKIFNNVSMKAKSLITKLLIRNPKYRISGEEALQDEFFSAHNYQY